MSCTNLLFPYLDYQLLLLFAFAATMLMVNKDYQRLGANFDSFFSMRAESVLCVGLLTTSLTLYS